MSENWDLITAYARDALNQGVMDDPTGRYEQVNSICGDSIIVYLRIDKKGKIVAYSHAGAPAIHTLAAASLLTESIVWASVDEVLHRDYTFMREQGFEVSPRRKRSAVSALLAARNVIHDRKQDGKVDTYEDLLE